MSEHTLVMTPGPGGHFQSPAGTEAEDQVAVILNGAVVADLVGDDPDNELLAISVTIAQCDPPAADEAPLESDAEPEAPAEPRAPVDPDAHTKEELVAMAEAAGVSSDGTKQEIADRLNAA